MEQRYNFALIPSEAVAMRAVEMSERLSAQGTHFTLNNRILFPHVSLYHITLDADRLTDVISKMTAILQSHKSFLLKQGPYRAVLGEWIDVSYDRDPAMLELHTAIIDGAKSFRAGQGQETSYPDWAKLSETQQANLKAYGWTDALELFQPHLTFTRLIAKDPSSIAALPREDFVFQAEQVGLFERGAHGTCTKLIYTFELTHN